MIKISKKVTFILMIIMCIVFVLTLREINWSNLKAGKNIFKEISASIAPFLLIIVFFISYIERIKEKN